MTLAVPAALAGVAVVGATWRSPWRTCALLFALAGLSQAAALSLVVSPPFAVYQHYQPLDLLLANPSWPIALLLAQGCVVAALLWRHRTPVAELLRRTTSGLGLLMLAGLTVFSAAVPTQSAWRFAGEVGLSVLIMASAALNLGFAAAAAPAAGLVATSTWLEGRLSLPNGAAGARPWDRALPWVAAGWVVVISGTISWLVMERVPHIDDSISNYFQAKYFAAGRLSLPVPPDSASFQVDEVIIDRHGWFGYGFPGWPALLAVGVRVGLPWLVNPLLGGALVLLTHALARRWFDAGHANVAAVLLATSPWLLFMSAEFMGHPASAAFGVAALYAVERERHRGRGGWGVVAGACIGLVLLVRPLDAVLIGLVGAVCALGAGAPRWRPRAVILGLMSCAAGAVTLLRYNEALTGRPGYTPQMMWTDRRWGPGLDRLGFGPGVGIPEWRQIDPLPGHGLPDVILNLNKNLFMTQVDLFGWAMGSLLLAALVLARRPRGADGIALIMVVTFAAGYSCYWFSGGPDLGPRYWYPCIVPLVILTLRGAVGLVERWSPAGSQVGPRLALALTGASLMALLTMVPWRAATKHYRYRNIGGDLRRLGDERGMAGGLVFVRSDRREDYQSAFNLNPAPLTGRGPIYAWDHDSAGRERVVQAFPDRPVWVVQRREGGFEVTAGPLPAGRSPP
jgi:dolichyl-phosphate-mannose-protein mannosyltransferase